GCHAIDLLAEHLELGARLLERHAGAQTRDNTDEILIRDEIVAVAESRRHRRWNPELSCSRQTAEPARKNADDLQRNSVHTDHATDERSIATESSLQQVLSDERNGVGAGAVVLVGCEH